MRTCGISSAHQHQKLDADTATGMKADVPAAAGMSAAVHPAASLPPPAGGKSAMNSGVKLLAVHAQSRSVNMMQVTT